MSQPRHRIFVGKDNHKFSAAHMTVFPDGTKERLHGHTYQVAVTLELRDVSFASFLDIGILKQAIDAQCRDWNEILLLAEKCPHLRIVRREAGELEFILSGKRYVVPADEALLLPVANVVVESLTEEFASALLARLRPVLTNDIVATLEVVITETRGQGGSYTVAL